MRKISIVIGFLSFIALVVVLIDTYKINKGYAEYHSAALMNDTSHLIASFEGNEKIFKEILTEGTLSTEKWNHVRENIYTQIIFYEDYHDLARSLGRYQYDGYSLASAAFLAEAVFNRQLGTEGSTSTIEVDAAFLQRVRVLASFNSECLKELHKRTKHMELNSEEPADVSVKDNFWIDILQNLNRLAYEKQSDLEMLLD